MEKNSERSEVLNQALRDASGNVESTDPLVSFLYELMRDHVTPGVVAEVMRNSTDVPCKYTNGFLAQYAQYVATNLNKKN